MKEKTINELREEIQKEYNDFIERDDMCELTDEELEMNFITDILSNYINVGFVVNNNIIEMIEF